jgi:hypothetical protein
MIQKSGKLSSKCCLNLLMMLIVWFEWIIKHWWSCKKIAYFAECCFQLCKIKIRFLFYHKMKSTF